MKSLLVPNAPCACAGAFRMSGTSVDVDRQDPEGGLATYGEA